MRLLISTLMLAIATIASAAEPSEVTKALFRSKKGFQPTQTNTELQALLANHPQLDIWETAAVGDSENLERFLAADPKAIQARSRFGWTLLHYAAFAGNVPNARLLLDRGADIDARAESRFRNTPLLACLLTGQHEMAKLLLERGADPLDRQAHGFAPIHEAAFMGRRDIVELLLAHGAELNSRTDDGRTALSEAVRGKHDQLAEFLKSKGATGEINEKTLASPQ